MMAWFRGLINSPSFPFTFLLFLSSCAMAGTVKSIGIFLKDMTVSVRTTSTDIGVALGLFYGFTYVPAPAIALVYKLRSTRRILLTIGACFIAFGVILASLATNNIQIALLLSLSGLGHCAVVTATSIALDELASKYFNVLFCLGFSGFGFGMTVIPILAELLRETYGWQGGLLILGGLMANIIPLAVSIKPGLTAQKTQTLVSYNEATGRPEEIEQHLDNVDGRDTDHLLKESKVLSPKPVLTQNSAKGDLRLCANILEKFRKTDFYLDPVFNMVFLSIFLCSAVSCGWHVFIVPHALQRGISVRNAIILTFSASIGIISGQILAGALSTNLLSPIILYLLVTLLNIVALLFDALISNYYVMLVTSFITGVSLGSRAVLETIIVRDRVSQGNFDIAVAVEYVVYGFGNLTGGFLSGMVADRFSSYDLVFKLLAGIEGAVFLFLLPLILIKKPSDRK